MSTIFDKKNELSADNPAWNAQLLTAVDVKYVLARCLVSAFLTGSSCGLPSGYFLVTYMKGIMTWLSSREKSLLFLMTKFSIRIRQSHP